MIWTVMVELYVMGQRAPDHLLPVALGPVSGRTKLSPWSCVKGRPTRHTGDITYLDNVAVFAAASVVGGVVGLATHPTLRTYPTPPPTA